MTGSVSSHTKCSCPFQGRTAHTPNLAAFGKDVVAGKPVLRVWAKPSLGRLRQSYACMHCPWWHHGCYSKHPTPSPCRPRPRFPFAFTLWGWFSGTGQSPPLTSAPHAVSYLSFQCLPAMPIVGPSASLPAPPPPLSPAIPTPLSPFWTCLNLKQADKRLIEHWAMSTFSPVVINKPARWWMFGKK